MTEFRIEKNVAIVLEKKNILQKNRDRQIFKEALQTIGRKDLAGKLEKFLVTGNSYLLLDRYNIQRKYTK